MLQDGDPRNNCPAPKEAAKTKKSTASKRCA